MDESSLFVLFLLLCVVDIMCCDVKAIEKTAT